MTVATGLYFFDLGDEAIEVLQELQILLEQEDNKTHGEALESTIVWYGRMIQLTDALRFSPPESQRGWEAYSRSLRLHPGEPLKADREKPPVRVESVEATRMLKESREILRLAETTSLEEIIRLRAEYQFRLADGWKVELGS